MNLFATSPDWLLFLLVCLTVAAAIQDALDLKISNIISLGVVIGAIAAAIIGGWDLGLWQNLVAFALILAVGTLLFSRGVLGGGDVKLFAALGLWADFGTALKLVVAILLCGGVLALAFVFRRLAPSAAAKRSKPLRQKAGIPYGVAIAAGSLLTITVSGMQI